MAVYLVDEATVRAIPGSNDNALLAELLTREGQGESLRWLDEELDIENRYPGFTHANALRDIFAGRITRPEIGFAYIYALGHVCSSLGEWVHNHFHRCSGQLLKQFDALFVSHGVGLRFWGGLVGNPPVPLPTANGGPHIGNWVRAEVLRSAPAFRAMRKAGPHGERWFEEMLDEVGEWITKVEARPESMLVAVWC
jgi:hypothetical protein